MHHILILLGGSLFTDPLFSLNFKGRRGRVIKYITQGIYRKERKEK